MSVDASTGAQHLVVTGSSAGGIEALCALVSSLRKGFPAPIVVAQHLDPETRSMLPQILAKRSTLPVRIVERKERLDPGTIFVVPSNRHVSITGDEVIVSELGPKGVRPSVDLLFSTASTVFGERLIAVILSGMGSDGVVGARMVKRNGGTVIIQDPETAMFPSMPLSLPKTSVDFTSKVEAIGPLITGLLDGSYHPRDEDGKDTVRALLNQVREESGIDFSNYKMPTILRRLSRLMAAAGVNTVAEYSNHLKQNPGAYQRLISAFLIRVTEFFRDPELFDYLRDSVFPSIIKESKVAQRDIRLWSAGCATGEEAYSLAIAFSEALGDGMEYNTRVFATDLDNDAVTFARRGVYAEDTLKDVPPEILSKYFTRVDTAYEVNKRLRAMVVFGQHDLGQRAPFPHLELVLCRNVLIYFTNELQQRTLHLFAYSLRSGGYLALGKSESVTPLPEYFEASNSSLKIYRRHGDRAPLVIAGEPSAHGRRIGRQAILPIRLPQIVQAERPTRTTLFEVAGSFLTRAPIGVIIVNRRYDVQMINAAARELLSIHSVAIDEDLIHLIGGDASNRLRRSIDAAFRGERPPQRGFELEMRGDAAELRWLSVMCYPGKGHEEGAIESAFLLISDITDLMSARRAAEKQTETQKGVIERLTSEKAELVERQRTLIEANNDLAKANVDLLANNEKLVISVEEAQSAAEEIETLNEEMQATNEELETVNEELQATVEELNTTNDELEARATELQDAAISRETQREAGDEIHNDLAAAFESLPEAIWIFDSNGNSVFQNSAFRRMQERVGRGEAIFRIGKRKVSLSDIAIAVGEGQENQLQLRIAKDGSEDTIGTALVKVIRRDGKPSGGIVVVRTTAD